MKSLAISWAVVRLALGQIESGNNDHAIGRYGEVSRYQILPSVWRRWTRSSHYSHEGLAWHVVTSEMNQRDQSTLLPLSYAQFYALWHRPAALRRAHFHVNRMPRKIRERCERFANLCQEIEKHEHP